MHQHNKCSVCGRNDIKLYRIYGNFLRDDEIFCREHAPERYIEKKEIKKMDLFIQYALAAAGEAIEDAKLKITPENCERIGVIVGTGLGGLPSLERYHQILLEKGPSRVSPFFIPMLIGAKQLNAGLLFKYPPSWSHVSDELSQCFT